MYANVMSKCSLKIVGLLKWCVIFTILPTVISGHYDKCVAQLQAAFKDNMAEVTGCIFSHSQVSKKNLLLIKLIASLLNTL